LKPNFYTGISIPQVIPESGLPKKFPSRDESPKAHPAEYAESKSRDE
jgi:hypothetical protein